LLLLNCGQSTLRLMPPLMIDRATADEALVLLERSLHEALEA
jgi:4-aminobutyrate aminotransferase-like enzyme